MSKTALLFAGQGAQAVGMGKALADGSPTAKAWFDRAKAVLGYDLASICFNGPESELTKTENAQPAIYLVSWIAFQMLKDRVPHLQFDAVAGLSLGEFTALAVAEAFSFEDGLRLVHQRGRFMQQACDATRGAMAAIIGLDEDKTRQVCADTGVTMANLNCPGQLVISGETEKIERAIELALAAGAKRAVRLAVAGAFHSPLMESAQPKLKAAIDAVTLRTPIVPVISNVTAQPHGQLEDIRALLVQQLTAPVRWEQSMRYLLAHGFSRFIELGPGTVLTGFMKRIDKAVQVLNVSDTASLDATANAIAS